MIRRLRLLGATLFALYCSTAFGLGMGELELKSALNQRFDGEIVLTKVGALEIDEILPNLASQADFDRVGVDRNYQLTDLRFSVRVREDGEYVVGVTSSKPVIEPFLNFIVEVIWPTGRILREYTVLLDPPVFGSGGIEKIAPGTTGMGGDSQRQTSGSTGRMTIPPSPSGRSGGGRSDDGEYGMTGEGDTLWTIAMNVRPSDNVSVQQTMLALQRANPEAFINDNINLLKAGYVLRVPDMDEIRAASREEAIAEVMVQNEEFSDYKASAGSVTQLDARRTASRESTDSDDGEDGELKLLASDRTGARSGADDARSEELENSLAVAREDLDRARRANTELNVRMDDLAGQVETLTELVQLKDDQLAALRAEVQKAQAAGGQPAPTTPPVTTQQPSQSLLSNPMVLGGLALVLIAGVVGLLIVMRKRKQSSDIEEDDFSEMLMAAPEEDAEVEEEAGEEAEAADEDEDVTQQTSDVIGEAEIYIAYGRFPQAISFLQNAIENEPERTDIQLKLLEVYVQTEDATAFNIQLEQLKMLGDDDATNRALELQSQIPGAAETSAAAMDATIVSSEPIEAISEPADDDDDLSFDLDDLDSETDDDELSLDDVAEEEPADELSLDEAMELGDAELDLDLDAALEEVATEDEDDDDALDLDLDEDIDLDFEDDGGLDADDDALELDLGDDDDSIELDLGDDDDDALDLGGDDDDALDLGGDDDDAIELDLDDDDDDALDLSSLEDDSLDLGDDDGMELDLGDDELDLGDLDDELNLDEDAGSKLDLARAYIEMGDNDGAKSLLQEVVNEGSDAEVSEANELLGQMD